MSYDLQIWSARPVNLPEALPEPGTWRHSDRLWTRKGRGWQVLVGPSDRVLPEDIPEEVNMTLPGIAFLTELNLSPVTAKASAKRLLVRVAKAFAKAAHGAVFDPQTDTITTANGVARLMPLGSSESASVIALSWWFTSGQLIEGNLAELVTVLEGSLPEALPRRYGPYEPPQHVYADTGRDHFLSFFRTESRTGLGIVVWYPHPPIADVSLSIPPDVGGSRLGFRCGRLTIEIDEDAIAQPGWMLALQRAWRRVSLAVQPFYGDVRRFSGFIRRRGRYWSGAQTEHHPVCSWWWAGIPNGPVRAATIGDPYRKLWPSFCEKAETESGLCFVSSRDWRSDEDVLVEIGSAPCEIAQPAPEAQSPNSQREYPKTWPFGSPRIET